MTKRKRGAGDLVEVEDELLPLIYELHGLPDYVARNLQTARTELIDGVLRGVMEDVVIAVVDVDNVRNGDTSLGEGEVVIVDRGRLREEVRLIAESRRRLQHQ